MPARGRRGRGYRGAMDEDVYTHGHDESVVRSHRWRTALNSAAYLLDHLEPGMSLLDVGCGPGTITADLARLVAPGTTVGIDTDQGVVDEARSSMWGRDRDNLEFIAGDFRDASLSTFDVVHAHQVLQHLRDPVGALRCMAQLTRPGGIIAVRDADYRAFSWTPRSAFLDRWLEVYLEVADRNGGSPDAGSRLLEWAQDAGLDAQFSTSVWVFEELEDRRWWAEGWADRVISSGLASQAVAYGVATREELEQLAAGWRGWWQEPDAAFEIPHGELIVRV